MIDRDRQRQRWQRFILVWMMGTALWIAVMLISQAAIRPAPSFYVMAPLVAAIPIAGFVIGLLVLRWRNRS